MNAHEGIFLSVLTMIWLNNYGTDCSSLRLYSNLTNIELVVKVDEVQEFIFDYYVPQKCANNQTQCRIDVYLSDDYILNLVSPERYLLPSGSQTGQIKVRLEGVLPGRVALHIKLSQDGSEDSKYSALVDYPIQVQRLETIGDILFTSTVILIAGVTNIGLGCEIDLDIVVQQFKTPTAILIGLCSQYVFMPLIAYELVEIFDLMPGIKLGLFALGCSPGGSGSNAYSYMLGGDVSLSITMTLVSTVAALGLIPLWLFTLGKEIIQGEEIHIPFNIIVGALAGIIIPTGLGVYIRRKHPRLAKILIASIKYLMLLFIVFCFTVGVWINWFCFQLMRPMVLLASALLPYIGFFFGGLAAFLAGQDKVSIITIAIETGIQNNGVPIVMMRLSMTGPERDTSVVGPVASGILCLVPFGIAIATTFFLKHRALQKAADMTIEVDRDTATNITTATERESSINMATGTGIESSRNTTMEIEIQSSGGKTLEILDQNLEEVRTKESSSLVMSQSTTVT